MTHHPRRPGRKANRRRPVAFSPFPCPHCRGLSAHTAGCVTHWSDISASLQLPRGMRIHVALEGTEPPA